jgi:hypothetical protein
MDWFKQAILAFFVYHSPREEVETKLIPPTAAGDGPHVPQEKQDKQAEHPIPSGCILGVFIIVTTFHLIFLSNDYVN